uniref:Uncharacterized protein n=1 Tax=Nelumbo nucifera TaxID=4432 RepID=A0A822Z4B2_NELNU|nr:TPA_asm: hypothetical protein HUJ06_012833 [Nelumbo nucifera]DAD38819.1 TPA_asm: hypothetical protein HUJ06_013141 [Nelumbo nucifera]
MATVHIRVHIITNLERYVETIRRNA